MDVLVPDIGDFKDIPVIDVLVKPGDKIAAEAPLITLESDKATMDVPAPAPGVVREVKVKVGDKVSQGSLIVVLEEEAAKEEASGVRPQASGQKPEEKRAAPEQPVAASRGGTPPAEVEQPQAAYQTPRKEYGGPTETVPPPLKKQPSVAPLVIDEEAFHKAHAGPGVLMLARDLGIDLGRVGGSGPKGCIVPEDVQKFVKSVMTGAPATGPVAAAPPPRVDFAKFGAVENKPLTR